MPSELGFGLLVTIQPVGVYFDRPVPIFFPNNGRSSNQPISSRNPTTSPITHTAGAWAGIAAHGRAERLALVGREATLQVSDAFAELRNLVGRCRLG